MESPIYYLAHPYSNDPLESFKNAQKWTYILRRVGFYPFSPILHTHPYYDTILDNFQFHGEPVGTTEEFTNYMNTEDFVDWDLKLLEGFMKGEGFTQFKCVKCGGIRDYPFNCCGKITQKQFYDSGVIMLLSHTAYFVESDMMDDLYKRDFALSVRQKTIWDSEGCRQEYEFAKKNHIRILELESFLEGKEVDL